MKTKPEALCTAAAMMDDVSQVEIMSAALLQLHHSRPEITGADLLMMIMDIMGDSVDDLAMAIGKSKTALQNKISGKSEFVFSEINMIIRRYNLPVQVASAVFFNDAVKAGAAE